MKLSEDLTISTYTGYRDLNIKVWASLIEPIKPIVIKQQNEISTGFMYSGGKQVAHITMQLE